MIWIDFAIAGLLCLALIMGLLKGFSRQAFSLVCWLLAVWVGLSFSLGFSSFLKSTITDPAARMAISFVALCLITLMVGGLIRLLLGELVKKSNLNINDRLGGVLFGAAHGMVFVTILVMLAGLSVLPHSPWWKESKLIPPFQAITLWLRDHIPSELTKNVHYR